MKTLSLLSLAAGIALLPTVAVAQTAGARGGAGVSWGGGARAGGGVHVGGGMRGGHVGGAVRVGGGQHFRGGGQFRGGQHFRGGGQFRGGQHFRGGGHFRGGWGGHVRIPRFRPPHGFPRRLQRGFFVHPFWFGPQFHINNWQAYGFADPGEDRRWVRYYDDAYLIDQGGRVVDAREGLDWDQYGERWETEDGIPSYYGRNAFEPGDEDYAYVEEQGAERHAEARGAYREERRHGGGYEVAYGAGGAYAGGYAPGYGAPMPVGPGAPVVYGGGHTTTQVYGGGYGYGMYAYPIIIETTTTTAGASTGYTEEVIEEVIETRQRARRRARPCNCARPRPPAGERG